jgi:putative tricarboxylic transport membrane protein
MLGRDGLTGLVVLAASLVLFYLTLDLKANPLVPVGPGFYPRIVLGITAVLSAALIISDLLARRRRSRARAAEHLNYALVLRCFLIFALYVVLLPWVGFRVATLAFVAALQAQLDPPKGARGWLIVLATAFVTTTVAYFLFEHYLLVLLPRGRWTDF